MNNPDRQQIRQRAMLLQRASEVFSRFGGWIPMAIAFVHRWPLEVELYPHWQVLEGVPQLLPVLARGTRARALRVPRRDEPGRMSVLQDFALYGLPVLVALGGWLYARHLRMLARQHGTRR